MSVRESSRNLWVAVSESCEVVAPEESCGIVFASKKRKEESKRKKIINISLNYLLFYFR